MGTNGVVSLGDEVTGAASLPASSPLIAAFWSDFDLTKNDGQVFYRASTDATLLQEVTQEVRTTFTTPRGFTAKEAVVVTWYNVTHTTDGDCESPVSNF